MSIIDNAGHSVVSYDGKNKAFAGQRLAKFSWKTVTDKMSPMYNIKRDSKCVSLPVIVVGQVEANMAALAPHLISYLHTVQDKMIREQLEEREVSTITAGSIDIAAICEWLEGSDDSGRLTKEAVAGWFNEQVAESLAVVLAEKLGVSAEPTQAENDKILAVVEAFKGKISALAGGKTAYEPKVCKSLISAIELAPAGDALAGRFTARLNKMIADSVANEALIDLL